MLLEGELQPCRGGSEGGGGGSEESSKQQDGRVGFAPHNSPEEQRFGKGYGDALVTSKENCCMLSKWRTQGQAVALISYQSDEEQVVQTRRAELKARHPDPSA